MKESKIKCKLSALHDFLCNAHHQAQALIAGENGALASDAIYPNIEDIFEDEKPEELLKFRKAWIKLMKALEDADCIFHDIWDCQ